MDFYRSSRARESNRDGRLGVHMRCRGKAQPDEENNRENQEGRNALPKLSEARIGGRNMLPRSGLEAFVRRAG
jgi:hypothetical protein